MNCPSKAKAFSVALLVSVGPIMTTAATPATSPALLPVELSEVGYVRVTGMGVSLPVPDAGMRFRIGQRLPVVQIDKSGYIVLAEQEGGADELIGVPRTLHSGGGSGWVTEQKELVFAAVTESISGQLLLRQGETLPVVFEDEFHFTVLCKRNHRIFRCRIARECSGMFFKKKLAPHIEQQVLQRDTAHRRPAIDGLGFTSGSKSALLTVGTSETQTVADASVVVKEQNLSRLATRAIIAFRSFGVTSLACIVAVLILIRVVCRRGRPKPERGALCTVNPLPPDQRAGRTIGLKRDDARIDGGEDTGPLTPSSSSQHSPAPMPSFYSMTETPDLPQPDHQARTDSDASGLMIFELEDQVIDAVETAGGETQSAEWSDELYPGSEGVAVPDHQAGADSDASGLTILQIAEQARDVEQAVGADTQPAEWSDEPDPSLNSMFSGDLSAMTAAELIQYLNATQKSGVLSITDDMDHRQGEMFFENGEIVHATKGVASAEQAVALMMVSHGSFVFKPEVASPCERNITQSTMALLMHLSQTIDVETPDIDQVTEANADSPQSDLFEFHVKDSPLLDPIT
jgi:hypothetical protein